MSDLNLLLSQLTHLIRMTEGVTTGARLESLVQVALRQSRAAERYEANGDRADPAYARQRAVECAVTASVAASAALAIGGEDDTLARADLLGWRKKAEAVLERLQGG